MPAIKTHGGDIVKGDSNKVQETVNAPSSQNAVANQKEQTTIAFAVKKVNKAITANMLQENKIADAQGSSAGNNNGVDPVKFASNGDFDPKIWGTMDISKWKLDRSGNITGYTGDMAHIIIPNSADFAKAGENYRQISISSDEMKALIRKRYAEYGDHRDPTVTLAISLTNDEKIKATNADWHEVFSDSELMQANLEGLDTSNITNMSGMFTDHQGLSPLTRLDVSNWDTSNVTDMNSMFNQASHLTSLDVSHWDTSKVTNMSYMFGLAENLTSLDVSKWNTSNVTNMRGMFGGTENLTSLDVSKWDTSKVTDMSHMFGATQNLTSLDVSKWDTSNVTNMSGMFEYASSLTNLDVSKWNTSKVTDMSAMFGDASSLTSLNVSNWNTSNVTDMNNMFYNASSLTSLAVSNWNTSKVTDMHDMFCSFWGASSLTDLDVSKWNTGKVTDMSWMFYNASGLTSLDVSRWDTNNVADMRYMFDGDNKLTLIANNTSGWQHATDNNAFNDVPVVITNNANILNVTDNDDYIVDGKAITRSIIFDSANSALKLPIYKGYTNYTSDADRLKYATDVIKVYNDKVMQDYSATHTDKMLKYADDQDMNDPIALARAKFITIAKVEKIIDNPENHDKLHATATREYIIHNIDGSTTTITQSINYHRTGKHNLVTNEDTFTEWIYSPDENSVVVVATRDKAGKAIASPVTVEGDNCVERNGKAYFGSLKIKPKVGFKLALDKPATAKLNAQAKLASRLLPHQFFVLKVFAPMPHKTAKPIVSANSIKPKQDHKNTSANPITSANAIKQGKDVIVKPVVKPIVPNDQTSIHDQSHEGSPINGLANAEPQLADAQNISMVNNKQLKSDVDNQSSMQITNSSAENSQKSAEAKLPHPVTRTNSKVKSTEIAAKSADSRQNQNKKVLAAKASAKPTVNTLAKAEKASAKPTVNILAKAEKVTAKPAVNIPAKTAQPAIEKTSLMTEDKQTNARKSLPQTSSANNLGTAVIGLIMSSLGITLAGVRRHE